MKKIHIIIITFILLACKKNKDITKPIEDSVNFFSNSANVLDGIGNITQLKNENAIIYFFNGFNSDGLPSSINSIVLDQRDSTFLCNYIFDSQKRPYLIYQSDKNGNKQNVILKLSYPSIDSVVYSYYMYDWNLAKDSLLLEQRIHSIDGNGVFTYGRISNDADQEYWNNTQNEYNELWNNWKNNLTAGILKVQQISGYNRLSAIWTKSINSAIANAVIINAAISNSLITIADNIQKTQSKPISLNLFNNTNIPTSPTKADIPIPSPKGTPSNPVGYGTSDLLTNILTGGSYKTWRVTTFTSDGNDALGSNIIRYTFNLDYTYSKRINNNSAAGGTFGFNLIDNKFYFNSNSNLYYYKLSNNQFEIETSNLLASPQLHYVMVAQ